MKGPEPELSAEQAHEIRRVYAGGRAGRSTLAARFGVGVTTVNKILRGDYGSIRDEGLPVITRPAGSYGTGTKNPWTERRG